jgi:uncharacterized membrane protein (UPF0182 family)
MYTTYHMQDSQVFYNKEDLLSIPSKPVKTQEPQLGRMMPPQELEQEIQPYYTIMRLPGEKKEEFVLLLPFTPNKKDNMRAWLAARSDGSHYGKLIALDFPKAKLVYGPKQIDARIEQLSGGGEGIASRIEKSHRGLRQPDRHGRDSRSIPRAYL